MNGRPLPASITPTDGLLNESHLIKKATSSLARSNHMLPVSGGKGHHSGHTCVRCKLHACNNLANYCMSGVSSQCPSKKSGANDFVGTAGACMIFVPFLKNKLMSATVTLKETRRKQRKHEIMQNSLANIF